jgi:hypothetical protein
MSFVLIRVSTVLRLRSLHISPSNGYVFFVDSKSVGLRSQDVYSGLQTVDQTSGLIATELDVTRLTGMAATVASNIKGIDLIKDPKVLTLIAAQQWGIDSFVLPQVLEVLQEVDYVTLHEDGRKKVIRIEEHIPLLHDNLYERLGSYWIESQPSELDRAAVDGLDMLASAPIRLSDLSARIGDPTTVDRMLDIGEEAQFAKRLDMENGDKLIWSPSADTSSRRRWPGYLSRSTKRRCGRPSLGFVSIKACPSAAMPASLGTRWDREFFSPTRFRAAAEKRLLLLCLTGPVQHI